MARARLALDGLSVGDALGETRFDSRRSAAFAADTRATAPPPWTGILGVLERHGRIEQDELARRFASDWRASPGTPGLHLEQVSGVMDWRAAAGGLFGGGSFGNGSAMRVAPLGILGGSGGPRSR